MIGLTCGKVFNMSVESWERWKPVGLWSGLDFADGDQEHEGD